MSVSHEFPATAAKSLVEGYCEDFVSLAASLAQTLEQISMRGINVENCRETLARTERGMRNLATAIQEMLERGKFSSGPRAVEAEEKRTAEAPPAPPAPSPSHQQQKPTPASAPPHQPLHQQPQRPSSTPMPPLPPQKLTPSSAPPPPLQQKPTLPPAATPPAAPHQQQKPTPPPAAPPPVLPPSAVWPTSAPTVRVASTPDVAEVKESESEHGLRGTTQSMPLMTVFQFLCRMKKSGQLTVRIDGETLTFDFVGGSVEFTTSDHPPDSERLGDILLRLYPAKRAQLEPVLQNAGRIGVRKLGAILVQEGILSNGQVVEGLERQVHARFHRAITSPSASYEFDEGERVPGDGRIRIRPFELLFESKRLGK
jgi:hypothetical protein